MISVSLQSGKTLLAKAVANQTSATFLRVCGSELIQKYLVRRAIIESASMQCVLCSICVYVFVKYEPVTIWFSLFILFAG